MNIHNLRIIWRRLVSHKVNNLINMTGLALGMTGFILALLYLQYELSYDKWDPSLNSVYQVSIQQGQDIHPLTPAPLARAIRQHYPAAASATAAMFGGDFEVLLAAGDRKIYQAGMVTVDSLFLQVFPYALVRGDAATALLSPHALILSEALSRKLFGSSDPLGKTVKVYNAFDAVVTGVMKEPEQPSHFNVRFLLRNPYGQREMFWENHSFQTFVRLAEQVPQDQLDLDLSRLYYTLRLQSKKGSFEEYRRSPQAVSLYTDRLTQLHNFPRHGASQIKTVFILLALAFLLLLTGCFNYGTLAVASAFQRTKEIGIRKVLGAGQARLVGQFMTETALQCFLSLVVALLLANLILPYFNEAFHVRLRLLQGGEAWKIGCQLLACLTVVIVLSGLYPALLLARGGMAGVLTGAGPGGSRGTVFRDALIVLQFTVSAFFVVGVLVMHGQLNYLQKLDKGFSGEQVMHIQATMKTTEEGFERARQLLSGIRGVESVSKTTAVPGDQSAMQDTTTQAFRYAGSSYRMVSVKVSGDFFRTLQIPLLQGRLFDGSYNDEHTRNAIINHTAARKLGIMVPQGQVIHFPYCDSVPTTIVGIVKDANMLGFERAVQPAVYTIGNDACMSQGGSALLVRLRGGDPAATVAAIESAWKKIEPDFPIRYTFLDDDFQRLFSTYLQLQTMLRLLGFAVILIAAMGLFAMTTYLMQQRIREIGIRKVLGAGRGDLALLLGKHIMWLILIAVVIAVPITWWATNHWLQGFAYRLRPGWELFLAAALAIWATALISMAAQILRASAVSPARILRTEG